MVHGQTSPSRALRLQDNNAVSQEALHRCQPWPDPAAMRLGLRGAGRPLHFVALSLCRWPQAEMSMAQRRRLRGHQSRHSCLILSGENILEIQPILKS